jgi:hypothetical protein
MLGDPPVCYGAALFRVLPCDRLNLCLEGSFCVFRLNQFRLLCCILLFCAVSPSQQMPSMSPVQLLDRMPGDWVMQGTIGGKQTTHDVHVEWVLNREYLQIHEVSREKKAGGQPAYEAIIYVGWVEKDHEYGCLWLDSTGQWNFSPVGLAHAKEAGVSIPFIFNVSGSDSLHTTFTYDQRSDTWHWVIDDITDGKTDHFADLKLARKS